MGQDPESDQYADRFEFIGGRLCLDFANTINYAGTEGIGAGLNERLKGLSGLIGGAAAGDPSPFLGGIRTSGRSFPQNFQAKPVRYKRVTHFGICSFVFDNLWYMVQTMC